MSGEPADEAGTLAVIACGALSSAVRAAARQLERPVELHVLSALLHDRPAEIPPAVEELARRLSAEGKEVVLAYADCGTYGVLDDLCARLGLRRLPGLHCYDLLAGPARVAELLEQEAGSYLLTDFLVRSFERTVVAGLGLDAHPELVADYFAHYKRVVWLRESPDDELAAKARAVAERLGLELETLEVGSQPLASELLNLLEAPR